jgi:hypothetical protein
MPENPEKPIDSSAPIEPAGLVKPIAGAAEDTVESAPKALPVAAKEPATFFGACRASVACGMEQFSLDGERV